MKFIVQKRGDRSISRPKSFPYVHLAQDNWDDFGYKTTYYAQLFVDAKETVDLGNIKILQKGQASGYAEIPASFGSLDESFCSVSSDLEYYETLFKLGSEIYRSLLVGLRDVVYNAKILAEFEDLEGFKVSLNRTSSTKSIIENASRLFKKSKKKVNTNDRGFKMTFKTQVRNASEPLIVEFDFRKKSFLPNRINVVIGYNGTGKTQVLANLATVASGFGYQDKEEILNRSAGKFVGSAPPINNVIVVSYSAFDNFEIPNAREKKRSMISEETSLFAYVYCGLRSRRTGSSKVSEYVLKTPSQIFQDFLKAVKRIRELERQNDFSEVLRPLLNEGSFQNVGLTRLYSESDDEGLEELFDALSTGHKVVLKIISELTAYVDGRNTTLVVIDEPEAHLHPPLLAAFLHSLRICLEVFDAYAILATHSPVVLQETPSRYVTVLRRFGGGHQLDAPAIETFGENIGVITQEVFNLDDGQTDWHDTLKQIAAQSGSLQQVEKLFGRQLGFSARSYIESLLQDE